eukprot:scaffold2079_cov173-Ochromonas_danica.AAC.8
MAQRKPSSSWTLRFQCRPEYSCLARFTDALDASQLAAGGGSGRSRMYFQEEELREDPEDDVAKDGEFPTRRMRQRRKFYRRKQTVVLEHPLAAAPLSLRGEQPVQHYEGKPVSVDFNPEGDSNQPRSSSSSSSSTTTTAAAAAGGEEHEQDKEQPFKYVLLQFVKTEEGAVPEIHVHPVGDFFTFRKTGKPRDDLLAEIEDKDKEEQERQAALLGRYKAISQTISNYESKRREEEKRSEQRGHGGALDSFSQAMMKVFSRKKQDSGRQNAALDEDMNAGLGVYMDENGLDPDALKEHDFCGGDYGVRFADDEEDHVMQEQEVQTRQSEQEMTSMSRYDEALDEDEESEEEEEEGNGGEGGEGRENGAQDLGSRELEAQANRAQSGFINDDMLKATVAARKKLMQTQRAATAAAATAAAASSSLLGAESSDSGGVAEGVAAAAAAGGPTKRSLESLDLAGESAKRVKFADGSAGDVPSSSGAASSAGAGASSSEDLASASLVAAATAPSPSPVNAVQTAAAELSSQQEYTLSESGVRKYILHRGGRVSVKELSEVFKPIIKAYSKALPNKLAGRDKFLDILEAVTRQMDDPLLGRAVELRDSHK